jgi:hypothetical protein
MSDNTAQAADRPARKVRYALAGEIVSSSRRARRILLEAQREGRAWLIPQARNVAIRLQRVGQ